MCDINLHNIFRYISDDEHFLSTVIENNINNDVKQKKNKQKGYNLMTSMIMEYISLAPFETQNYIMLPHKIKSFLTPDYVRLGVKNVMEKNSNTINISFLNSVNILIRPEIYKNNNDEYLKNFHLFENFVCHKIQRNYQIDKMKNTKKVQAVNKELIKKLSEGKISHDLIQRIINIFEINLLVFDLTNMDIFLYWSAGHKYPFINLFNNIYSMAYVQGNYEPIMPVNKFISEEQKKKIYIRVLTNLSEIKCIPELKLTMHSLIYLNSWNIDSESYIKILEHFFRKKNNNMKFALNELIKLEK